MPVGKGYSATIGILMVAFGGIIGLLALLRYVNTEKQLNNNAYSPSKLLPLILTLFILIGSMLLVLYLLPNI